MSSPELRYGITRTFPGADFDAIVQRTTEALKSEGFGVLTTIDVRDTMKKKLDVDFPRYLILGACNPHLAHQALVAEPGVGLLLPCNVTVFEAEGGLVTVQSIKPEVMFEVVKRPDLEGTMREASERLQRVMDKI
jgi:uncharacterized protein (DUF302 family)